MPKRKSKNAQFINENNIKIVVNTEPKKRRRRRRKRKPKAIMNSINNLRFRNNLKPVLSNIPLSTQIIHQDKLTTDGLKESNIRTTEALKQLTNFMTSNMGRQNTYPQIDNSPVIQEIEDEEYKQIEDVKKTPKKKNKKEEFFTPFPMKLDNEEDEIDTFEVEVQDTWRDILTGVESRDFFR